MEMLQHASNEQAMAGDPAEVFDDPRRRPLSPEAQAVLEGSRIQTGFSSYHEYLKYHLHSYPSLERLCSTTGRLPGQPEIFTDNRKWDSVYQPHWIGSVLNLSIAWDISLNGPVCKDTAGIDIIEALCHPPEDAQLQILLLNECHIDFDLHKDFLDFLGLCFEMEPREMAALLHCVDRSSQGRTRKSASLCRKTVSIGNAIATLCKSRHLPGSKPVFMLVISSFDTFDASQWLHNPPKMIEWARIDRSWDCPPFLRAVSSDNLIDDENPYASYVHSLARSLKKYGSGQISSLDVPLLCLLPLLDLNNAVLSKEIFETAPMLVPGYSSEHVSAQDYYKIRRELRYLIDTVDSDWSSFVKFIRLHCSREIFERVVFQDIHEEYKHTVGTAHRLESQMRDDLSLEAGRLGIEESKRSIELSNKQIEEAKRGKFP